MTHFADILACATCMGAPGHQNTVAAGQAIVVMLWILLGMAILLAAFVYRLVSRARRYAREHPVPGEEPPAPSASSR